MTENLTELIAQTTTIENLLTANPSASVMPTLKTIHKKADFKIWQAKLKEELRKLKQEGVVLETVELLSKGFKNGFTDEEDFTTLKANLMVIGENLEKYQTASEEKPRVKSHITEVYGKLAKGQKVYTAFSQYELIQQIGSGGNGRVFSVKDSDGETYAIKFIEKYQSNTKLKRFKNEINFCEHHKHKNIVPVLDRGQAFLDGKDLAFYVMPLYAETLKDKIKEGIPSDKVLDIFVGLLEGLKYAHEHGTIHRDIKPENIMFTQDSFDPVICDFGIAHFAEEDLLTMVETKATDRMANFQYAAPEQRKRGGNVSFQTDIYALALILNEMFTGEIPQAADHKRIEAVNPDYKYLDDLFDQMYKQDPEDRLYPEVLIFSELKALTELYKRELEKEKLKSTINEVVEPEAFNPSITNIEFKNGALLFTLDMIFPDELFHVLRNGTYSHSWTLGYDTGNLRKVNGNEVSMPIRGNESKDTIKSLVENVKSWIATVSREYSENAKRQAIAEQRRREEARVAEIERIERESAMNSTINSMLKDLL